MRTYDEHLGRLIRLFSGLLVCAAIGGGCAGKSVWEESFVPNPRVEAVPLPEGMAVEFREVSWDRLQGALRELEAEAASSDTHPDEWAEERKAEMKSRLLRALQVSEDPSRVVIIGRSHFRAPVFLRPETRERAAIESLAQREGATRAVWSRRLVGRTETIVNEPVSAWTWGFHGGWAYGSRHRGGYWGPSWGTTTAWVPVVVEADEYAYSVYFLRIVQP